MGTDYIYASSYIRSKESKLLSAEQFRGMTEAKELEDVCKILQEAGYGTESRTLTPANYQEILRETEKDIFEEIKALSENHAAFDLFCFPADYHNLKVLLKAEALGVDRSELLMENGTLAPEVMAKCVHERDRMPLTENMQKALEESVDTHARTKDPQSIDVICDKYCFRDILSVAETADSAFVTGYVRLWIDTVNLKSFVRVRKMGQPWTYYDDLFVPGGEVPRQVFLSGYDEDNKHLVERFQSFALYEAISRGGEAVEQEGTFALLEKLCDDLLMRYVREARHVTFGLAPLVAFLLSRQNEIRGIRILMAGKIAGMDPELIRERLRETYE